MAATARGEALVKEMPSTREATLSFGSRYGWYGLRVEPSFEEVMGTLRKPLHIPLPLRTAKWEMNSPYRALLEDLSTGADARAAALADYRRSGAEAPETVAGVQNSDAHVAMADVERQNREFERNESFQFAKDELDRNNKDKAGAQRSEALYSRYGSDKMNPTVEPTPSN